MVDLKQFREDNELMQITLARYLDVSKQYLSHVENGRCDLSIKYVDKLLNNDMGWDTRSLLADAPLIQQRIGNNSSNNTQVAGADVSALEEKVKMLEKLLEEKERTIQILLSR